MQINGKLKNMNLIHVKIIIGLKNLSGFLTLGLKF